MSHQTTWEIGLPVPEKYIGYADKLFYYVSFRTGYYVHSLGITPNMITFFGLCCNIITAWSVVNDNSYYIIAIIFGTLADTMDGFNARRFNQVSKYGALFDHGADWISGITIIIASVYRWCKYMHFYILFSFILYLEVLNLRYSGFVQQYQGKSDVYLSSIFQHTAKDNMLESKLVKYKEYSSCMISVVLIASFAFLQNYNTSM